MKMDRLLQHAHFRPQTLGVLLGACLAWGLAFAQEGRIEAYGAAFSQPERAPATQARVYAYRAADSLNPAPINLYLNGRYHASLLRGGYTEFCLSPGRLSVQSAMDDAGQWQAIDAPIALHWPDRPRHHVGPEGKPSLTWWRVLAPSADGSRTWLALRPVTGRSHQLRVHLSWLGHPICGDALYAPAPVAQAAPRLLLHAWRLGLPHPVSGDNRVWQAPLPAEFQADFCQRTVVQGLHNALTSPKTGDFYA